jgi:hypothetical protein
VSALHRFAAACLALCLATSAQAAPEPLSDDELAAVHGREGIVFAIHLVMASKSLVDVTTVNGVKTYLTAHDFGGTVDIVGLTLDRRRRTDGGTDYLDIGMPLSLRFVQFGFSALTVQTDPFDPLAAPAPGSGYGQLRLDGTASMTGHFYFWPDSGANN